MVVKRSWLARGFSRLLTAPIRWYRRYLSPLKSTPTCRFLPTCSEYALEAIEKRGPVVGAAMAAGRVLRCNPLFVGGYHPVSEPAVREPAVREPAVSEPSGRRCIHIDVQIDVQKPS